MVQKDNMTVRPMAGSWGGATGPIKMRNPGNLLDVTVRQRSLGGTEGGSWAWPEMRLPARCCSRATIRG